MLKLLLHIGLLTALVSAAPHTDKLVVVDSPPRSLNISNQWNGQEGSLNDLCNNNYNGVRCGPLGANRKVCLELGCCYKDSVGTCHHKTGRPFLAYTGEHIEPRSTEAVHHGHDTQACAHLCHSSEDCSTFSVHWSMDNNGAVRPTCHMSDDTRNELQKTHRLRNNTAATLYQPIPPYKARRSSNFEDKQNSILSKFYVGCFADGEQERDLAGHMITGDSHMTVQKCVETCRQQRYGFAGLQNGTDCFCGNGVTRLHGPADNCELCSYDSTMECGGQLSNSIYTVNPDRRYIGCFKDKPDDRNLPHFLWHASENRSADECIGSCMLDNFDYAAIQNGGDCYCGDSYDGHGKVKEIKCHMKCPGYGGRQGCGGDMVNSVYLTERAYDMGKGNQDAYSVKLYDSQGSIQGFSTSMFSFLPGLRNVVTNRLIIYSAEPVLTPTQAGDTLDDSYRACGEISNTPSNLGGDDVTLMFFYLRLSDLHKHVGPHARRVKVYAQTVLIDTSLSIQYSLLLRARQIILDRSTAFNIEIIGDVLDIRHDSKDINYGPDIDITFAKFSFTCARILLDTLEQNNVNTAWGIMQEIADLPSGREEVVSFSGMVQTHMAQISGTERMNVHIVPMYTKTHLVQVLDTYYDRLTVYKTNLERLEDSAISDEEFLRYAEDMNMIYVTTAMIEASYAYEQANKDIRRHELVYGRMYSSFQTSRKNLEKAEKEFRSGIRENKFLMIAKSTLLFVKGVALVAVGAYIEEPKMIVSGLKDVASGLQNLDGTMDQLARLVNEVEFFMIRLDAIQKELENTNKPFNPKEYIYDVEMIISLQEQIIHWRNLKNYARIILSHKDIMKVRGAGAYNNAVMDLANWGEALSKSMVERAEAMRDTMYKRSHLDDKVQQLGKTEDVLKGMKADLRTRPALLAAMHEQTTQVRLDIIDSLLTFCQAYFFENLGECRNSYKPAFGDSLSQLLLKINAASRDSLLVNNIPSTVARVITIRDTDLSPDCNDVTVCPINYLRHNRELIYEITPDHPDLVDLHQYRVAEIELEAVGATSTTDRKYLQFLIDASGDFQGRTNDDIYSFLTRALARSYEYDIESGHVSVRADVYQPLLGVISHITPYTTWVIRIYEERSANIDLSHVTELKMTLHGSSTITASTYSDLDTLMLNGEDPFLAYYFGYRVLR